MEMEQWLEDAMVVTNKSLRLMPSSVFKRCLESCRNEGASLVTIARAGSQLGLVDETKLPKLKESIPEPGKTPPTDKEILAFKHNYATQIEAYRFWLHYTTGAAKEIPVVVDFQEIDQKAAADLNRVLGRLTREATTNRGESEKETKHGDSDNSAS